KVDLCDKWNNDVNMDYFFPNTGSVYDDGRTTIFNENHPFHFIFCITFLIGTIFLIYHAYNDN
ncbi:TPA: hypothetical protein ACFOBV_001825, partial [Neisseria meningitidis]